MRRVLDTNTALLGPVWGGPAGALIDAARAGRIGLVSSIPLIAGLEGVFGRPKFARVLEARRVFTADLVEGYATLVELVGPARMPPMAAARKSGSSAAAVGADASGPGRTARWSDGLRNRSRLGGLEISSGSWRGSSCSGPIVGPRLTRCGTAAVSACNHRSSALGPALVSGRDRWGPTVGPLPTRAQLSIIRR